MRIQEKALKDFEQAKALLQQRRVKAQADYIDPATQFVRHRAEARPIQTVSPHSAVSAPL